MNILTLFITYFVVLFLHFTPGTEGHLRALIFGNYHKQQDAKGAVSEDCIRLARNGDCKFYSCFEARHTCSEENFAMAEGWRYCSRYQAMFHDFTLDAQEWLNGTRQCTMRHLVALYRKDTTNCHRLRHEARAIKAACNARHGICDVTMLMMNRDPLAAVYRPAEVFEAACQFFRNVRSCGLWKMRYFLSWAARQVSFLRILFGSG